MKRLSIVVWACALLVGTAALAQDGAPDCPAFVAQAVQQAAQACANTGINQVCFGSGAQEVIPRGVDNPVYDQPGATADLAALDGLALYPQERAFGIAVLRPQANLLDDALTMVAYGVVDLVNDSAAGAGFFARVVRVASAQGANVRGAPAADADVLRQLYAGDSVTAVGRSADGVWILLLLADGTNGWAAAELLAGDFDFTRLPVAAPGAQIASDYAAFQSFGLQTTRRDAPCGGAPDSGLLVQAPAYTSLYFRGVGIAFAGTVLLQGSAGDVSISVLEGTALITVYVTPPQSVSAAAGERVTMRAEGTQDITVTVDAYEYTRVRYAPLLLLPRPLELPFSIGGLLSPFAPGGLRSIGADEPCTIAWTVDVNLRAGPGTSYPIRQGVAANQSARPDGRAVGTDGALWWRLADGVWLSSANTGAAGACAALPTVDAPAP